MVERIFPARQDQLEQVQRFVEEQVEQYSCSSKVKFQLAVAVEEIFVNIAHYATARSRGAPPPSAAAWAARPCR